MVEIENIVLNSILTQNGLNEDEFDIHGSFADNGIVSIDMLETLIDIEDELDIQGYSVELELDEVNVYEDNFYTLLKYVESKL